ncbi:hypothetical protein SETIT_1G129800v2 [Setaria italica]|uniref:F-box protein AT5G49610-like beta-propeller domain-containing protein n=1 Tax=Setaria italica TaxID=4555 RepID=A0A368PJQ2_SETIT|nr:uncharacterized protein LOC101785425 [Setaria italica]RCV06017.1 hypothetical protein SETIT_1G129800v2 [Setaria italica]
MEAKREIEKSTLVAASTAMILLVFGDCDLLGEIFIRLGFTTDLVRAAAACRRWLWAASDPTFLRRFRDIHPPRLLGFYLTTFKTNQRFSVDFIPLLPQPPELAAVVRRESFSLGSYVSRSTRVMDCRNGRVVVNLFRDGDFTYGEHSPLHPARECGNGLSYFWFEFDYSEVEEKATARVYKLQDDAWSMQTSATTQISGLYSSTLAALSFFLVDDKIHMGITVHNILVLDLTSSTFSTIKYPDTVEFDGDIMLSRTNDSGICLVHVSELQLQVWLHKGCDGSMVDWLLVNSICLRDLCTKMNISNSTTEDDDDDDDDVFIHAVGDNAEFVFMQMYGCVLYLDVRHSALQKVCSMTERNACVSSTHPFLMAWPPIFPALEE